MMPLVNQVWNKSTQFDWRDLARSVDLCLLAISNVIVDVFRHVLKGGIENWFLNITSIKIVYEK